MGKRVITNEQRDFKGVWIPAKFWLDPNLTLIEVDLLTDIDSLDINSKGCFKSNDAFADFFGVSASRISQMISTLKKKGYLEIKYLHDEQHPKQITKRIMHVVNNLKGGSKNTKGGYLENCEESNTVSSLVVKNDPENSETEESTPNQNQDQNQIIDKSLTDHPLAYYQQAFGESPRGTLNMLIDGYARAHSFPWVNSAMKIAAVKGKKWDYALAIIQKWEANQWNTVEEVEAGNRRYLQQKQAKQSQQRTSQPKQTAYDVPTVSLEDVIRDALENNGNDVDATISELQRDDVPITAEEVRNVANG